MSNIDIEAVRFTVEPDSEISGQKIIKIARKLKKGSIIGIIVREDRMILPGGETTIESGDHVIVITHRKLLPNIASLFKPRSLFSRR